MIETKVIATPIAGRAKTFSNDTLVLRVIGAAVYDDTSRPSSRTWHMNEISGLAEDDAPADYHLSHAS
jgi:hypothetical protein